MIIIKENTFIAILYFTVFLSIKINLNAETEAKIPITNNISV